MKILTSQDIKALDKITAEKLPVAPLEIIEAAAQKITSCIVELYDKSRPVIIFAGPGNNGADALAVARMLYKAGRRVEVCLFNIDDNINAECSEELKKLGDCDGIYLTIVRSSFTPPKLNSETLVIDGLFGIGLNRPLTGGFAALVKYINASESEVVSIDTPSGLMAEDNTGNSTSTIIRATHTLTIELPKLSFFFPENEAFLGHVKILRLPHYEEFLPLFETPYQTIKKEDVKSILRPRGRFAHKGDFGHAMLIAGSYGMAGAAILASRACLRSGVGRLTVHTPVKNNQIMQISVPEAMVDNDVHDRYFAFPFDASRYEALAIGPGLGTEDDTALALKEQIAEYEHPMIVDADAINILAYNRMWANDLPAGSILTPHIGEFDRLAGHSSNGYERLSKALDLASSLGCHIILKGRWSSIITPEGNILFNPTGNPGMATAGSGDVLTGILLALLAQGYSPLKTAVAGTFIHGLAGDMAALEKGWTGLTAGDIAEALPKAWKTLE